MRAGQARKNARENPGRFAFLRRKAWVAPRAMCNSVESHIALDSFVFAMLFAKNRLPLFRTSL
jgi:hypothetical protein